MYADRALVLPWVSGSMSRDKIGGFVVQGILRFTNPVLSFSGHRPYKDNVFIGFAIRTAVFSCSKSMLRMHIIKIHPGSNQFKHVPLLLPAGFWKKKCSFVPVFNLTGRCSKAVKDILEI